MIYTEDYLNQISFPLGGIGAGSIGLAGNGALVDWEINNRPNRESINPFSFFAVKAENDREVLDWRVLQGDITDDFMGGKHTGNHSWGYGHGPNRARMAGLKHFREVAFDGEFPFAQVTFSDPAFPARVVMTAFNPFIPSNEDDSSIPAALFELEFQNQTDCALTYTASFSAANPLEKFGAHEYRRSGDIRQIVMHGGRGDSFSVATDCPEGSYQEYWYRGAWFDDITMFVNDFSAFGPLKNRRYDRASKGKPDVSTLTASVRVPAGESGRVRLILAWYVPAFRKYWGVSKPFRGAVLHNYYARLFGDSGDAAKYCIRNFERLLSETMDFKRALYASTLPASVLDAIQGNIATLKTTTCLRLEDGYFWAWEGVGKTSGSCDGTCQHVWNYAYALPFLFPRLERGVRQNELHHSLERSGELHFRMQIPLGSKKQRHRACVDGQMGTVIKCWREWKISGDTAWLKSNWSRIRRCIEYAWSPKNRDRWDPQQSGVITGRQHHTLDVELFGVNSWLTGFYHAALLAGADMAQACGDETSARLYREIYARGHQYLEENTFNGRYYVQQIDLRDRAILDPFFGSGFYWDDETGQIKYQLGGGCEIDQVVADWHTGLIGLPAVFDPEHRRSALEWIYRLNFKSMDEHLNPCRVFACNDEKGVVMCAWENGAEKPAIPIPYTEECMTGFEYAFACSLLQCGMEAEALEVVSAIRGRYDGKKRNPWAEIECGASYARAMASYALLLTYSGFRFDAVKGEIGFAPIRHGTYFWSLDGVWGTVDYGPDCVTLHVLYGKMRLEAFTVSESDCPKSAELNGLPLNAVCRGNRVECGSELAKGDSLKIELC